jgi:nitroreductase
MTTIVRDHVAALTRAAEVAGTAPSIHNTQPWHWRIHDDVAHLYADLDRHLSASDPDRRMLVLSCGIALHHAAVSLTAHGKAYDIVRLPDPDRPEHLATVSITGRAPVTPDAVRLMRSIAVRRTDRRPLLDAPLIPDAIGALRSAADAHGTGLDILDRDQMVELAVATERSQINELADDGVRAELHRWTVGDHPEGTGIPRGAIPEEALRTTVPSRDFGSTGSLPISDRHDAYARYAILYGVDDDPRAWLTAGEATSALWLAATQLSVAVLPLSAPVETPAARHALRRILGGIGYPYLALRIGIADPNQAMQPRAPRLAPSETVELIAG